jgi:hypothetical protein
MSHDYRYAVDPAFDRGNWYTCAKCLQDYEDDDILWATIDGKLEGDTKPYCVACAPEQPHYEKEGK